MNNSVLTLSNNNLILNEPKYEMSSPGNNGGNIGLTIDQNQLLQITQLMNELTQQQQQQQSHQQQTSDHDQLNQQALEILLQDQNQQNTIILSPNSLLKFNEQQQQTTQNLQQLFIPQQIDQQQVHTIMLNGQPALFIPASAAINSNLLNQVLQSNQLDLNQELNNLINNNNNTTNQIVKDENVEIEPESLPLPVLIQQDNNQDINVKKPKKLKEKSKKLVHIQPATEQPVQFQIIQNSDQQWIIINNDQTNQSVDDGKKLKRKACDCPNCIEYKKNGCKEDVNKKRTHKCHKCSKEYNKTSHLRAHLRGHDNYRPYVCDFKNCTKSFTRSDELKRHKRIHNDDRNFVCHVCKKKFLRSDHLGKHLLVHSKSSIKSTPGTVGGHLASVFEHATIASLTQQVLNE
ncbi:unnamed protein product [Brachionus calyciflorus]|uniref:C2H2-type domain-containing protein n=1 Tax=Brachionus calyciflorus TaxID=104777 RepID=A0A813M3A9_9BILA|nr:unnamed protein product [Brachionus calyciflorus]